MKFWRWSSPFLVLSRCRDILNMCHYSCSGEFFFAIVPFFATKFASHCLNALVDIVTRFKLEFLDVALAAASSLFAS